MAISKITNAERDEVKIYGLPDKPGLSKEAMQQRFDGLGNLAIDKINEMIDSVNYSEKEVKDLDSKVEQISNNQIPEEYLQASVDDYINNNNAGIATKKDVEEIFKLLLCNDFSKIVVDNAVNCTYAVNEDGVDILSVSNGYASVLFENKVIYTNDATNIVIGKCTDGIIMLNASGRLYYVSNDARTQISSVGLGFTTENLAIAVVGDIVYFIDSTNYTVKLATGVEGLPNLSAYTVEKVQLGIANQVATKAYVTSKIKNDSIMSSYTINVLGDSLTHQNQYTSALASMGYVINNYGVSGTSVSDVIENNPFYSRVESMTDNCDFIFMLGGTNDWGSKAQLGTPTDTNTDTFYGGLYNTLYNLRVKYPTKTIVVGTIPQRSGCYSGFANGLTVEDFNEAIKYMSKRFGCFLIDSFRCGICAENFDTYTTDGLHFNALGGLKFATFLDMEFKKIPIYKI